MRKLMDLVKKEEKVWIHIDNEDLQRDFARQCAEEGITFSRGQPVTPECTGYVMALHADATVGNLSIMIWTMSYGAHCIGTPPRVEYDRYMEGYKDYTCYESHFTGGMSTDSSPRPEKNLSASDGSGEKEKNKGYF